MVDLLLTSQISKKLTKVMLKFVILNVIIIAIFKMTNFNITVVNVLQLFEFMRRSTIKLQILSKTHVHTLNETQKNNLNSAIIPESKGDVVHPVPEKIRQKFLMGCPGVPKFGLVNKLSS